MSDTPLPLKLAELAEKSGVAPRTIRLYISRGLLPGPVKAGPGAAYGQGHLYILREIQRLQAAGRTLAEIRLHLAGSKEPLPAQLPEPVRWMAFQIAGDVTVQVRADAAPWRLRQIRKGLAELQNQLASPEPPPEPDKR